MSNVFVYLPALDTSPMDIGSSFRNLRINQQLMTLSKCQTSLQTSGEVSIFSQECFMLFNDDVVTVEHNINVMLVVSPVRCCVLFTSLTSNCLWGWSTSFVWPFVRELKLLETVGRHVLWNIIKVLVLSVLTPFNNNEYLMHCISNAL